MPDRERLIDLRVPDERAFLIGLEGLREPAQAWPVGRSLAELAALAETPAENETGR